MYAYAESYLKEVVETQGKLFEEVAEYEPGIDVKFFIKKYMESKTREYIDHGQAYVLLMQKLYGIISVKQIILCQSVAMQLADFP